jgi:hypothetical protein
MRMLPIDDTNLGHAFDLLQRGFPERPHRFWEAGLARMRTFGDNAAAGWPLGQLLLAGRQPVGVVLTPVSLRAAPGGPPRPIVNLSSWYVEPEHRGRAPLMLRGLLRDRTATYTDLTPSGPVQRLLHALGFTAFSAGIGLVFLPAAAATRSRRGVILPLDALPADALDADERALLRRQAALGCELLAFASPAGWQPLVLRRRPLRRLPAAQVLYCRDHVALAGQLGPLARHLLRAGCLFLIVDRPAAGGGPGLAWRRQERRFVKGGSFAGRTDHLGSELCYFDFWD